MQTFFGTIFILQNLIGILPGSMLWVLKNSETFGDLDSKSLNLLQKNECEILIQNLIQAAQTGFMYIKLTYVPCLLSS
jgi:hypothetical protein